MFSIISFILTPVQIKVYFHLYSMLNVTLTLTLNLSTKTCYNKSNFDLKIFSMTLLVLLTDNLLFPLFCILIFLFEFFWPLNLVWCLYLMSNFDMFVFDIFLMFWVKIFNIINAPLDIWKCPVFEKVCQILKILKVWCNERYFKIEKQYSL